MQHFYEWYTVKKFYLFSLLLTLLLINCRQTIKTPCEISNEPGLKAISGCFFNEFDNTVNIDTTLYLRFGITPNQVSVSTYCNRFDLGHQNKAIILKLTDRRAGTYFQNPCSDVVEYKDLPRSPTYSATSGILHLWIVPYQLTLRSKYEVRYRLWATLENVSFMHPSLNPITIDYLTVGIDEQQHLRKLENYEFASFPKIKPNNIEEIRQRIKKRFPEGGSFSGAFRVPRTGIPELLRIIRVRPDSTKFESIVLDELKELKYSERKEYEFPEIFIDYVALKVE